MDRWECVLATIADLMVDGRNSVAVDGYRDTDLFAQRLMNVLRGKDCVVTAGPGVRADVVVWLRTAPVEQAREPGSACRGGARAEPPGVQSASRCGERLREPPGVRSECSQEDRDAADVVVDLHDVQWPVIRYIRPEWADRETWYLREIQAFFGVRAATWDRRFGDDLPAYAAAVDSIGIEPGAVVADIGCGTGRALAPLREAAGPGGVVLGLDVTPEMLVAASDPARRARATLAVADARSLPLRDGALDVAFTAGLLTHLPDIVAGLAELGRVTRPGGRLALFHPSGRVALAARHGRTVMPGEPLDAQPLRRSLAAAGWELDYYDDPPARFLALATRRG